VEVLLYPVLPDFRNSIAFWKVPSLCPLVLLIKAVLRSIRVWRIGGMILTEGKRSTERKSTPNVTLSTRNPTWTDLGSKPGLRHECLRNDRAFNLNAVTDTVATWHSARAASLRQIFRLTAFGEIVTAYWETNKHVSTSCGKSLKFLNANAGGTYEKMLETERGSTRSHSAENSLWKRLWNVVTSTAWWWWWWWWWWWRRRRHIVTSRAAESESEGIFRWSR
jgi:hypothetical protein